MQTRLKKIGVGITSVTAAMSVHSYYLSLKDISLKNLINTFIDERSEMGNTLVQMAEDNSINEANKIKLVHEAEKELRRLESIISSMREKDAESLRELFKSTSTSPETISDVLNKRSVDWSQNVENSLTDLKKIVDNYKGSGSEANFKDGNNLIDEIRKFLDAYQAWFDNLSVLKQGAITHILISTTILLLLTSLVTTYYSDALIKYFNIESKYPRLAKYIVLRRKFQQYYFFLNTLGIVLALAVIIALNVFIFINF